MSETLFRDADTEKELKSVVDFMAAAPMHYPRYHEWLERAEAQMLCGTKHVLTCRQNGRLAATLTWQTHPREPFTAELKNMRVVPECRGMEIGRFLVKAFERRARESRHAILRCDMGADNVAFPFFLRMGWRQVELLDLYNSGMKDILMVKTL